MYVYKKSPPSYGNPPIWTVGFYAPDGTWEPESDHNSAKDAANRTAWLNGSKSWPPESVVEALNSGDGTYRP